MRPKKLIYLFALIGLDAWATQTPDLSSSSSEDNLVQIQITTATIYGYPTENYQQNIDGYTPRPTEEQLIDQTINKYGNVISSKGIFNRLGIDTNMILPCEDVHKLIYKNVPTNEQALIFANSIMEGRELFPIVSKFLVPGFWRLIKAGSGAGKYILSIGAPFLSSIYAYLEHHPEHQELADTLNIASLITFQFGAYALNNIYNYSSELSTYYSNILLEKKLIKSTINYQMPEEERHNLPQAQKPDGAVISTEYFNVFGKIGTELARTIINENEVDNPGNNVELAAKAQDTTSLTKLYRISHLCSFGAGICRTLSETCGMITTVLAALSVTYVHEGDEEDNNFVIPQVISSASALVFGEFAKLFEKGAYALNRKIMVYPVYNKALLDELKEQQPLN